MSEAWRGEKEVSESSGHYPVEFFRWLAGSSVGDSVDWNKVAARSSIMQRLWRLPPLWCDRGSLKAPNQSSDLDFSGPWLQWSRATPLFHLKNYSKEINQVDSVLFVPQWLESTESKATDEQTSFRISLTLCDAPVSHRWVCSEDSLKTANKRSWEGFRQSSHVSTDDGVPPGGPRSGWKFWQSEREEEKCFRDNFSKEWCHPRKQVRECVEPPDGWGKPLLCHSVSRLICCHGGNQKNK